MSKLVILPTVDKNTQPTYHLKSDFPQINFSEFNEKRDYDFEEKNSSENYSQITIITSYSYKFQCQLMTFINFQRFIEFVTSLSTFVKGFTLNRLNSCDLLLKYFEMLSGRENFLFRNYYKSKLCLKVLNFHS